MKVQKNWNSLSELLQAFNQNCNYLILRNYEKISDENYYLEGHDDIDFLCDDQKKMRRVAGARRSLKIISTDHFFIKIKGSIVKIGIRYVGDGYYDKLWEKHMLENRSYNDNGFYTMNSEDYFYSLIYHSLLQKRKMADDYKQRLFEMGKEQYAAGKNEEEWLEIILNYLQKKEYRITAPLDAVVPMRKDIILDLPKSMYTGWNTLYKLGRIFYWIGVKFRLVLKSIERRLKWVRK